MPVGSPRGGAPVGTPAGTRSRGRIIPVYSSGVRLISYGDSITEHNHRFTASTELSSQSAGEIIWAKALLGNFKHGVKFDAADAYGRSFTGMNLGDTADTAQNMAGSTRLNEANGLNPDVAVVNVGTNDLAGRTAAQIIADRATIYNSFIANGAEVMLRTIPPRGDMDAATYTKWKAVNDATLALSVAHLHVYDPNPLVEDPTNPGKWLPGMSVTDVDTVHFSTRPGYFGGKTLAAKLRRVIGPGSIQTVSSNLVTNPTFTGTAGIKNPSGSGSIVGTVPDSWRVNRASGTASPAVTMSVESGKLVFTWNAGGSSTFENYNLQQFISSSINIARDASIDDGEFVQMIATIECSGWGNNLSGAEPQLTARDVGNAILWRSVGDKNMDRTNRLYPGEDFTMTCETIPFVVTTAMVFFNIELNLYPRLNLGQPGVMRVSNIQFGVVPDPTV